MQQLKAKITYHKEIKKNYRRCVLEAMGIAAQACPGQFLQIKTEGADVFLRRPFSIHAVKGEKLEVLYAVLGKGTQGFAEKKAGEYLDIIGPLGRGFSYHAGLAEYRLPVLVAGGMGVAPLFFLAQSIRRDYPRFNLRVLLGARNKSQILCVRELKSLGCQVNIATDDGSQGFKGKVTGLLKNLLRQKEYDRRLMLYACGPKSMLKELTRLSQEYQAPAQVSLEEHMACGIGACLGCIVKTVGGYQRVCKEGPVFDAKELIF